MATTTVRQTGTEDWVALRDTRLAALTDAPEAFGSSLAREQAFDEATWRQRATPGERRTWLAIEATDAGERVVGLVGVGPCGHDPDSADRELVSMWVAPSRRGSAVAGLLVDAVLAYAWDAGAGRLVLMVVEDNHRARRSYERLGFAPTGRRFPLRRDPTQTEVEMSRDLPRSGE